MGNTHIICRVELLLRCQREHVASYDRLAAPLFAGDGGAQDDIGNPGYLFRLRVGFALV